ncbi:MAG: hypothetical protein ABL984_08250 [Pyrinomonadaceae bacterium]
MRQYKEYPIYINVPPPALKATREKLLTEHGAKQNFRETARLRNVQKYLDDIQVDPAPNSHALAYENMVVKHLDLIASRPIGKVTLDSLNPKEKIWIIPLSDDERPADCNNCEAYVRSTTAEGGGGIRLYYSPGEALIANKWVISTDDTFYHEIVHALRFGWSGSWEKLEWIDDYENQEEFIATIMENLYVSSRGGNQFYSRYIQPSLMLSKQKLYELYARDERLITWFRRCTFGDSFIWAMARRTDPPFNPWRDRAELENKWLKANRKRGFTKFPGS